MWYFLKMIGLYFRTILCKILKVKFKRNLGEKFESPCFKRKPGGVQKLQKPVIMDGEVENFEVISEKFVANLRYFWRQF